MTDSHDQLRAAFVAGAIERGLTPEQAEEAAARADLAGQAIVEAVLHPHWEEPLTAADVAPVDDGPCSCGCPASEFDGHACEDYDGASDSSPTREQMLEAIPLDVPLAVEDDVLDSPDPALCEDGRRRCIAERRAGGRCTATAPGDSLLCNAHSGRLDPSAGGHARAKQARERRGDTDERLRLAALGTRAVILEALREKNAEVKRAVEVLADAAAAGDIQAGKLLIPYMNQALGNPTERVEVSDPASTPVSDLSTEQLAALVARGRAARTAPAQG